MPIEPLAPQVIAKPTRRRFSAEYRLRILEEADRCTARGEIGRLLRREGLYTSHLSKWRQARRSGVLQALTLRKQRVKRTYNSSRTRIRQLEAKMARLEKELATAHTILEAQGKAIGLAGIPPQQREPLLMATTTLAMEVGIAPACRALGVCRATFYRRQRPAPGRQ